MCATHSGVRFKAYVWTRESTLHKQTQGPISKRVRQAFIDFRIIYTHSKSLDAYLEQLPKNAKKLQIVNHKLYFVPTLGLRLEPRILILCLKINRTKISPIFLDMDDEVYPFPVVNLSMSSQK